MITYNPVGRYDVRGLARGSGAWVGIRGIVKHLIDDFCLGTTVALELGVFRGFSASILSQYFTRVIGIDMFWETDINADDATCEQTKEVIKSWLIEEGYHNITLIRQNAYDYIKQPNGNFDLIHIDLFHSYEETMVMAEWALKHSDFVIFHDTMEPQFGVMQALLELEEKYKLNFYNFPEFSGLGILTTRKHGNRPQLNFKSTMGEVRPE